MCAHSKKLPYSVYHMDAFEMVICDTQYAGLNSVNDNVPTQVNENITLNAQVYDRKPGSSKDELSC